MALEADAQTATALLTEHLQYTPLSLIDDIINSVNNFAYQGIGSLETGLFSTPPERLGFKAATGEQQSNGNAGEEKEYPEAKQEIEEGLHKLETLLNSTIDKNFDKFEIYVLRNILSVPADLVNWIRLSHYDAVTFPPSDNVPTIESVQLLRQKLSASRTVTRALLHEHQRNEIVLEQLRALLDPPVADSTSPNLNFLLSQDHSQASSAQPGSQQTLTTNVNFALSQLPALKVLLAELRPKLALLKNLQTSNLTAKDEVREERRGYIEQRTRAHLDRNGRSLDTNTILAGKRPDEDELRALEKMSAMLDPP